MGLRRESPKIVQIDTRYVETDAVNFRDVVQRLTGKNSSTDWIGRKNNNGVAAAYDSSSCSNGGIAKPHDDDGATASGTKEISMQMNKVSSFNGFDGIMLPSIEMMPWSYS